MWCCDVGIPAKFRCPVTSGCDIDTVAVSVKWRHYGITWLMLAEPRYLRGVIPLRELSIVTPDSSNVRRLLVAPEPIASSHVLFLTPVSVSPCRCAFNLWLAFLVSLAHVCFIYVVFSSTVSPCSLACLMNSLANLNTLKQYTHTSSHMSSVSRQWRTKVKKQVRKVTSSKMHSKLLPSQKGLGPIASLIGASGVPAYYLQVFIVVAAVEVSVGVGIRVGAAFFELGSSRLEEGSGRKFQVVGLEADSVFVHMAMQ